MILWLRCNVPMCVAFESVSVAGMRPGGLADSCAMPGPPALGTNYQLAGAGVNLPFHLLARGEYQHVGRKPEGGGFVSLPVREFRGALVRQFESKGIDLGLNLFIASGYGGQTVETLALPGEGEPFDRLTGFPLRSYITGSITYRLRRRH